jgi:hypothetical protein
MDAWPATNRVSLRFRIDSGITPRETAAMKPLHRAAVIITAAILTCTLSAQSAWAGDDCPGDDRGSSHVDRGDHTDGNGEDSNGEEPQEFEAMPEAAPAPESEALPDGVQGAIDTNPHWAILTTGQNCHFYYGVDGLWYVDFCLSPAGELYGYTDNVVYATTRAIPELPGYVGFQFTSLNGSGIYSIAWPTAGGELLYLVRYNVLAPIGGTQEEYKWLDWAGLQGALTLPVEYGFSGPVTQFGGPKNIADTLIALINSGLSSGILGLCPPICVNPAGIGG